MTLSINTNNYLKEALLEKTTDEDLSDDEIQEIYNILDELDVEYCKKKEEQFGYGKVLHLSNRRDSKTA